MATAVAAPAAAPAPAPAPELSKAQAAVYDRQMRMWGVETQRRLASARVLVVGCSGLAAEVAKNVVLAGVGSVALVDGAPAAAAAPGNFLVARDAPAGQTVAEASAATLQEMNPLVSVAALPGSAADYAASPDRVRGYDVVLLTGAPAPVVAAADAACAAAGAAFFAAACRSAFGWAFANLHEHAYIFETKEEQPDGSTRTLAEERTLKFAPWAAAMAAPVAGGRRRAASPLLVALRAAARVESATGRAVSPGDLPALRAAAAAVAAADGPKSASVVDDAALAGYAAHAGELPSVAAIVSGVLANDLLKAAAGKGAPVIDNLFLYSLLDGTGWVERLG
jgi:ubiquitin-like 1-activating enzyme E1 A